MNKAKFANSKHNRSETYIHGHITDDVLLKTAEINADKIASALQNDIVIERGWDTGYGVAGALIADCLNPSTHIIGKKREGLIIFDVKDNDFAVKRNDFEAHRKTLKKLSHCIADHHFTIKSSAKKIIGFGVSPYVYDGFNHNDAAELKNTLENMLALMNPDAPALYNVIVFLESIYYPSKTITIMFMKK